MKLQVPKRILKEDFNKDDQELVEQLAAPINEFFQDVSIALSNNLTIEDNLSGGFSVITVQVNSDGIPVQPASFNTKLKQRLKGLTVVRATNTANSAVYPTGQPFISFAEDKSIVNIKHITGLPTGLKWTLIVKMEL